MGKSGALLLALVVSVTGSGCATPVAVWPELPAGLGWTMRVRDSQAQPVTEGYVLFRVYEYDGSGVAEGDRNARNQQVFDAAFECRQPVRVHAPPGTVTRYRLERVEALPIRSDGSVRVPPVLEAGSLWIVPRTPQAENLPSPCGLRRTGGVHRRVHFGEVQALVRGQPPSDRRELALGLGELQVPDGKDAVRWRRELESAREDLRRGAPDAFLVVEFVERELAGLAKAQPEAFVPDGVGLPTDHEIPLAPSKSDEGIAPEVDLEKAAP